MHKLVIAASPERAHDVICDETRRLIDQRFDCVWADESFPEGICELVSGADVVLTTWGTPALEDRWLLAGDKPAVVAHAAGTVKHLVSPEAMAQGVVVFSAAGRIAWSVGEYCLAAIMTLLRRLPQFDRDFRAGRWKRPGDAGRELLGRRVGIIGASSTARALIAMLQPFRCEIVVYDPYLTEEEAAALGVSSVSLVAAMASDVVSVHVPNVPATEGLIGAEQIALIPDGSILVNSARAASVDTAALVDEVIDGRLSAALDVFDVEPMVPPRKWADCPGLLLTPHIAGVTRNAVEALAGYVLTDALRWLDNGSRGPSFVDIARQSISA